MNKQQTDTYHQAMDKMQLAIDVLDKAMNELYALSRDMPPYGQGVLNATVYVNRARQQLILDKQMNMGMLDE